MNAYRPDESNIGVWLWAWLLFQTLGTVAAMDLWLRANNHEYLTTEFREGLHDPWMGALLAFITIGTVGAFIQHMWINK